MENRQGLSTRENRHCHGRNLVGRKPQGNRGPQRPYAQPVYIVTRSPLRQHKRLSRQLWMRCLSIAWWVTSWYCQPATPGRPPTQSRESGGLESPSRSYLDLEPPQLHNSTLRVVSSPLARIHGQVFIVPCSSRPHHTYVVTYNSLPYTASNAINGMT